MFDLDGTLVNTIPLQLNCYKKAFINYNIAITDEDYYSNMGGKQIFDKICIKYDVKIPFWDWYKYKNDIYFKLIDGGLEIAPGASNFIKKLKSSDYGISVVSSSSSKNIIKVLKSIELRKYIDFIIGAEKTDKGKPSPDPYLFAVKKHKLYSDQCIAFEDTKNGIISAKKAGLFCAGISCFKKDGQRLENADIVYKNFNDIDLDNLIKYKNSKSQ